MKICVLFPKNKTNNEVNEELKVLPGKTIIIENPDYFLTASFVSSCCGFVRQALHMVAFCVCVFCLVAQSGANPACKVATPRGAQSTKWTTIVRWVNFWRVRHLSLIVLPAFVVLFFSFFTFSTFFFFSVDFEIPLPIKEQSSDVQASEGQNMYSLKTLIRVISPVSSVLCTKFIRVSLKARSTTSNVERARFTGQCRVGFRVLHRSRFSRCSLCCPFCSWRCCCWRAVVISCGCGVRPPPISGTNISGLL